MDVWRLRMGATMNRAAVTLAFLLRESRRYQTFVLWRHRYRTLNRTLIVPALDGSP